MGDPVSTGIAVGKALLDVVKFVDGKMSDADGIVYRDFLRKLTDYRLFTSEFEAEYAGAVIEAAQRLRQLIVSSTTSLPANSKLENAFLGLGTAARSFITTIDRIESSIRHELDLIEANAEAGITPDPSRDRFLQAWKRKGYPERVLRDNPRLNVMEIEWPGYQMQFLLALGQLRGRFGIILETLCEASHIELPEPLASLTPDLDSVTAEQESSE